MSCVPHIKDAPSSVGFGRIARRCSACRRATVQVPFVYHFLRCFFVMSPYFTISSVRDEQALPMPRRRTS
jgi:hypothetical protein